MDEWERIADELPARKLVVASEVLSRSSGHHDKVTKRIHYGRHVSEYWIVDLDSRVVERWCQNDERPEILAGVLEWSPEGAAEPFRLDLPRYFAECFGAR